MKSVSQVRLKGKLKSYMNWPLYIGILFVCMNAALFFVDIRAGFVQLGFTIIYFIICGVLLFRIRSEIMRSLVDFAVGYGQVQKSMLNELEVPYAILDSEGRILWHNSSFDEVVEHEGVNNKYIYSVFDQLTKNIIPTCEDVSHSVNINYKEKDFRVELRHVTIDDIAVNSGLVDNEAEPFLVAVYLFDITEMNGYIRHINEEKFVAGLIYIDNYDEVINVTEEARQPLLMGIIDRTINKTIGEGGGIVRKLEKDKYFVVMRKKFLEQLEKDKFPVLATIKSVNIGNEMSVTVSIGIGAGEDTYIGNYELARKAMDLALGRGGDQVVVKENDKVRYYGGKSQQVEKNTRVKARVKAHALKEIIENKDKIIIMGHRLTDVDSFGAAVGIYRCAKALNKRAYIVLNEITTSVRPFYDLFVNNADYEKDMIIKNDLALELADSNTTVIIVDVNTISITECPQLLDKCKSKVVLDHHRTGSEPISGAVLSYIEPFASSACEMVAEIVQYIKEGIKLKPIEADVLYSGMIIDTDNFANKAGVRTFEAAAYLRRSGADITRVRKLLRNDIKNCKAMAEAITHAQLFGDGYVLSITKSEGIESPTIVAAQAANELLGINGIKASFVLTVYNDKVYISARSIDEVNVQLIMEKLGGGGHMNVAGAQLANTSTEEAAKLLKETVAQMTENKEI